eukprot:Gregarina_sp_Poly_1__7736@NODE_436_length_8449_cov_138_152470_g356_i0_p4_GENE_NODE_436_length_8449_cov_138_152470_g356_i0NODE_436_length_8449_cov_138_152470_g356_i0_p4_ORF_typecomplete_len315_score36_80Polyketide_cyc2/PF10604_9/0_08_NODE_436_length_8449_cov_138_152470_g356_i062907234
MAFDKLEHLALGFDEIEIFALDLRSLLVAQVCADDTSTAICSSLQSLSLTTHIRDIDAQAAVVLLLLRSFETTPQLTPSVTSLALTEVSGGTTQMGTDHSCCVNCPVWLSHDCRFWRFPSLKQLQIPALKLASPEILPIACPHLEVLKCLYASPSAGQGEANELTSDVLRLKLLLERCSDLRRLEIWLSCDLRGLTLGIETLSVWNEKKAGLGLSTVDMLNDFESVAFMMKPINRSIPPFERDGTILEHAPLRIQDYLVSAPHVVHWGPDDHFHLDPEFSLVLSAEDSAEVVFACAAGWKASQPAANAVFFLMV